MQAPTSPLPSHSAARGHTLEHSAPTHTQHVHKRSLVFILTAQSAPRPRRHVDKYVRVCRVSCMPLPGDTS